MAQLIIAQDRRIWNSHDLHPELISSQVAAGTDDQIISSSSAVITPKQNQKVSPDMPLSLKAVARLLGVVELFLCAGGTWQATVARHVKEIPAE